MRDFAFDDVFQMRSVINDIDPAKLTIDYVHGAAKGMAEFLFITKHECPPLWFIGEPRFGRVTIFEAKPVNDRVKQAIYRSLSGALKQRDCDSYAHISEAWSAHIDDRMDEAVKRLRPAQRMDRQEVLIVASANRAGRKRATRYEIIRSPNVEAYLGKPEEIALGDRTGFGGDAMALLD